MIRTTQLPETQKTPKTTTTFRGYNHNEIISDGEMYDMMNLTPDLYPLLSVRKKRGITRFDAGGNTDKLTGISGRDQLVFCWGKNVYYGLGMMSNSLVNGIQVDDDPDTYPKKIVNMGAYVCIWPDKVYFNTADLTDCGRMDRLWSRQGDDIKVAMCRGDGSVYDAAEVYKNTDPPDSPTNGQLWIDQSGDTDVLRQYDLATEEWVEVATVYCKIYSAGSGIGVGLRDYDAVDISGIEAGDQVSDDKLKAQLAALNGSHLIYRCGDDYIVVQGLITHAMEGLKPQKVEVNRNVPDLDFIIERNNRLWGCRYGLVDGQVVNEIRASALGDFRVWDRYMGNSQDSYTVNVGTDGPFTGAVAQLEYPVFFKENCIHRISGDVPSGFRVNTTICRGIQKGSWRSAVVVNEAIYYKSRQDVMMYDGSIPVSVSSQFGGVLYKDARAGAVGGKYYISMQDQVGNWTLFMYDTEKGLWFKEDGLHAAGFGRVDDDLICIDEDNNTLVSMRGFMGEPEEDDIPWSATFGLFGTDYTHQKYLSRFNIRIYLEPGCKAKLEIEYDSSGDWEEMGELTGTALKTIMLPVIPKRCDHLRFRISGEGECRIYSITRNLEVGGDG